MVPRTELLLGLLGTCKTINLILVLISDNFLIAIKFIILQVFNFCSRNNCPKLYSSGNDLQKQLGYGTTPKAVR